MEKLSSKLVLLLICILSRLLSSVTYIEDVDGLNVALSVFNESGLSNFGIAFSGQSLFIIISKFLYFIVSDLSIIYSILGGIALYFIITFILKLINVPLVSLEGILTGTLIFFNPLIWIISNTYLPDLLGTAIVITSVYYLVPDTYHKHDLSKGWFLAGILGGFKASFYPLLLIPMIYVLYKKKRRRMSGLYFFAGLAIWILPLVLLNGWSTILDSIGLELNAQWHQSGVLFNEYTFGERITAFIQSIWADGLGGYWLNRNISLLPLSIGLACCLFFGFFILFNFDINRTKATVLIASLFLYSFWLFFFRDIFNESNEFLPLIAYLLILVSYGVIYFLVNFNYISVKVLALTFILGNIFLTVVLVVHHTYPTAVAQAKDYISNNKGTNEVVIIIAPEKIANYLSSQNVKARFVPASDESIFTTAFKLKNEADRIIILGFDSPIKDRNIIHFSHNPYINRRWPHIFLYEYYNK